MTSISEIICSGENHQERDTFENLSAVHVTAYLIVNKVIRTHKSAIELAEDLQRR